jgi:transposase InsO family protein
MSQRREFVALAGAEEANVSELCRRFGISRRVAYKWLGRYEAEGESGLADRSRRPRRSPGQTPEAVESSVLELRAAHPAWGGRKLRRRLQDLGAEAVPAASTITEILRRQGRLDEAEAAKHQAFTRFERAEPNDLWQMDFKGHFAIAQGRCHPLTVLDDHSRYALGLAACADERTATVQAQLTAIFRRYGLPWRMLMDNGAPWGNSLEDRYTPLTLWLLRLGVAVSHGKPYHPQTQGKDERFHRTLAAEVLRYERFRDLAHAQQRFDAWREVYNLQRPHEALGLAVPASRYTVSPQAFPEVLPAIEYAPDLPVRKVQDRGELRYQRRVFKLPKAFKGYPVALRPTARDGELEVLFCRHVIARLDLRVPEPYGLADPNGRRQGKGGRQEERELDELTTLGVTHVSEHLLPLTPV